MEIKRIKKKIDYKKIFSLILILALLISLGTSSLMVSAEETNENPEESTSIKSPKNTPAEVYEEQESLNTTQQETPEEKLEEINNEVIPVEVIEVAVPEDDSKENESAPEEPKLEELEEEVQTQIPVNQYPVEESKDTNDGYYTFGISILRSILDNRSSEPLEYTDPEEKGLILNKTASIHDSNPDTEGRQIFKIDLRAEATSDFLISDGTGDIVLILDNSSSLNGNMSMPSGEQTVENGLKTAAKDFVDDIAELSPTSKMVIINSKKNSTTSTDWLYVGSQQADLVDEIDNFNPNGSVSVEEGLLVAENKFFTLTSIRPRYVILISGDSNWGNTVDEYASSTRLKGTYGATIYTIGIYQRNNSMNEAMWTVSSNYPYTGLPSNFEYLPNELLPNGTINHYKTTETFQGLSDIFQYISEQLGETIENAVVKDYIDSRFDVVDSQGIVLNVGATLTINGNTGTIKADTHGVYVEWPPQTIAPETSEGAGDEIVFRGSIFIKPKVDFIGGNNIPTNIKNITAVYAVDQDENEFKIGSFPNPLVNVPFKLTLNNIEDNIFQGENILRTKSTAQEDMIYEDLVSYDYPDGMLDYNWNPDFLDNEKPMSTTVYDLLVTATPLDYIQNPDLDFYHLAVGEPATLKIHEGTYTVNVRVGTLTIKKTIINDSGQHDSNQTFVFEIKQYDDVNKTNLVKTFYETLRINSVDNSRTIINLPKGYYEVLEKSDWSWQYDALDDPTALTDTLGMNSDGIRNVDKNMALTSFTNSSMNINWLTSIDWVINNFTGGGS